MLTASGLTLTLGYPGMLVAWLYPLYYMVLLSTRQTDDNRQCRRKYGELGEEHEEGVPRRIIPGIYRVRIGRTEGRAESRMDQAIEDRRDDVFLMTKVCAREALETGRVRYIGVIGMKSPGGSGQLVTEAGVPVEQSIRHALSQPITALVERTCPVATDERFQYFKMMQYYDSGVHRVRHGFRDLD